MSRYPKVSAIPTGRRRGRTRTPGRVCATPDCGTVLSIYNTGTRCPIHTQPLPPRRAIAQPS